MALPSVDARAELLFRSAEIVDGRPGWSAPRKYSNPSDTAFVRSTTADAPGAAGGPGAAAQVVRVILSGEITRADLDGAAVMAGLLRSGRQKIESNTVWLASHGGDIDTGMDLGRLLRKLRLSTFVGRNDQCASACVFAFMGGERRSVAGRLGIHRPFFQSTQYTPDRPARFRHLQRTISAYVEEMDFPPSLYEAMMLVPPESIEILGTTDLRRFYLEGISPSDEDRLDAAAARRLNLSMFAYLKRKADAPPCAFLDAAEGRCEGKVLAAATGGAATIDSANLPARHAASAATAAPAEDRNPRSPPGTQDEPGPGVPQRRMANSS